MKILEKIITLINSKGISEKQFLQDIGLNRSALSDWKSGKNKSYTKHLSKIADYFNVSVDYLLGKTNNPTLDEQLKDIDFALAGKIHDLTDDEKQRICKISGSKKNKNT